MQIVKVQLEGEFEESYKYLRKMKVNCSKLIAEGGIRNMYEFARQMKYNSRKAGEKQEMPF